MKRMATVPALTALVMLALVGCGKDPVGPQQIEQLPRDLSQAESALIDAGNSFGLKLFREIHAKEEAGKNIFISPLSVSMALGMVYNGANGATREAMQQTLELQGLTVQEINESYRSLIDLLAGLDPRVTWQLANSIWYRQGFSVESTFLDVNRTYFDAEVAALDFNSPSAAPTINAWVEDKTNGRIKDIVEPPIPFDVVMYVINAIYFKGKWTMQFDKDRTTNAPFTLADGSTKTVPMMTYSDPVEVGYNQSGGVEVLDLDYGGRAYSMTIVIPGDGDVAALAAALDATAWQGWVEGVRPMEGYVRLPRFKLEYEVFLKEVLSALGMGIAFDELNADFTGINRQGGLFISDARHKTFVEVNEEGTEAAAATSVEVGVVSLPPTISVDRPFLFAIREKLSGTILFIGLILDPAAS